MSLADLTVVVLNWETADLTEQAVRAVLADGVPDGRVVVVDNGSRDGSAERLAAALPEQRHLALPANVGYAAAANAGARALAGAHYLVMNNDAFVHRPGSVAALVRALDDPSVGLVVPRLLNPDLTLQRTVRPRQTPGVSFLKATGFGKFVPNRWQPRWSHHWDHGSSQDVEAADGAVVLVRGTTWDAIGGYNERRPMYAEDSDLCWRVRRLGQRIRFEADAEFVHIGAATSSRKWSTPERAAKIGREEARLLHEQLSPAGAAVSISFILVYLARRAALHRLRGDAEAVAAIRAEARAYREGLRRGERPAADVPAA